MTQDVHYKHRSGRDQMYPVRNMADSQELLLSVSYFRVNSHLDLLHLKLYGSLASSNLVLETVDLFSFDLFRGESPWNET